MKTLNSKETKEQIQKLRRAQELMREANGILKRVHHKTDYERLRCYIIGHLEPLIDADHEWLDSSTNLDHIIKELERLADGED